MNMSQWIYFCNCVQFFILGIIARVAFIASVAIVIKFKILLSVSLVPVDLQNKITLNFLTSIDNRIEWSHSLVG